MDLQINRKVAFVMGGSRGIGHAVAIELAAAGCHLAIIGRGPQSLDTAVRALRKNAGAEVIGIAADLSQFDEIDRAIAETTAVLGAPEIAIFNPPTPINGSVMALTEADFAQSYHEAVLCFMHMVKQLSPAMKMARWGRIVTIGAAATKQPVRGQLGFDYAIANVVRLAAVAMAKTLSAELGEFGITINTIATGSIASDSGLEFFDRQAEAAGIPVADYRAAVFKHVVVGRIGALDEIASLAAYLCSNRAAYTTGENILCDGGLANCAT